MKIPILQDGTIDKTRVRHVFKTNMYGRDVISMIIDDVVHVEAHQDQLASLFLKSNIMMDHFDDSKIHETPASELVYKGLDPNFFKPEIR